MIRAAHTSVGAWSVGVAAMLCFALTFGCASDFSRRSSAPTYSTLHSAQLAQPSADPAPGDAIAGTTQETSPAIHTSEPDATTAQPVDDESAAQVMSDHARARISPALRQITAELDAAIERCSRSRHRERIVSLELVRNLSHASPREFDDMRTRMATLLTSAAATEGSELTFVADDSAPASFVLLGAAYLVTLEGFDSWELYLSLSRQDAPYDLWRSEGPVRVLRFEQPMAPQVFYAGPGRR